MKIGHPKNFWGGVMFAVIGLIFAAIAKGIPWLNFTFGAFTILDHTFGPYTIAMPGYTMGTPARMGPAFFPFYLGTMMLILGLIIMVDGIRRNGGKAGQLEKFHWEPVLWVLGAIVMFGILLKPVGMLLDGIMLIIVASKGSHAFRIKPVLILAVSLTIFCALVFVAGLKLPIPLCPDIEPLQAAIGFCRA